MVSYDLYSVINVQFYWGLINNKDKESCEDNRMHLHMTQLYLKELDLSKKVYK